MRFEGTHTESGSSTPEHLPWLPSAGSDTACDARNISTDASAASTDTFLGAGQTPGTVGIMSENSRLHQENALLREQYRLASENQKLAQEKERLEQLVTELSTRTAEPVPCVPSWVAMPMMPMLPTTERECVYPAPPMPPMRWFAGQEGMPVHETAQGRSDCAKRSTHRGGSGGNKQPIVEPQTGEFPDARTTVMVRNLPNNYDRATLLAMFNAEGFAGQYDFVYLPIDFTTGSALGYAFVIWSVLPS
mmetsp:Transcript_33583/g.76014  ORF Transcript_33583/g.76014 Transcript_33583/m.76014 type:complete len:248 (+) Transcript_33583:121-864(+)